MISRARAIELRQLIEKATKSLTDEEALECVTLFPEWAEGIAYIIDQRIAYDGKLYRVVQAHTSQAGWTPDVTPALFTEVAMPGEIPIWRQPTGAQDAYMLGDKVWYPDKTGSIYASLIDNNVWAPGTAGLWEEVQS